MPHMNPHQQQAILTLLQQVKSSIVGIEQLILMAEIPSVLPHSNPVTPASAPGSDLKEDEDDELSRLMARERAEAAESDATLQDLWAKASTAKVNDDAG